VESRPAAPSPSSTPAGGSTTSSAAQTSPAPPSASSTTSPSGPIVVNSCGMTITLASIGIGVGTCVPHLHL
jgi:hypothetical protein